MMKRPQWLTLGVLAFLALFAVPQRSYAANCRPDTRSIFRSFYENFEGAIIEHLYWIDVDTLHTCSYDNVHGQRDLTTTLGFPVAASPVLTAVPFLSFSNAETNFIFVVNTANHLILNMLNPLDDSHQSLDLSASPIGQPVSPWTSVAATVSSTGSDQILSVAFAVDHPNDGPDKYGVRKSVWRYDFNTTHSFSAVTNLYSAIGRSVEHLETQVNIVTDTPAGQSGNGRVYTTFDPEGQGHIHFISSLTEPTPSSFVHQDLMDVTGVGGMDVTTGGGIVTPNLPTCQASGVTPIETNNGNVHMIFYGKDTDLHELYGNNTTWQKRDITHESGGPHPDGCGQFAVTRIVNNQGGNIYLLYEAVVTGGRGLVQATLIPGQSWSFQNVVNPLGGTICTGINVLAKSPLAIITDGNGVNHYYYLDTVGRTYRDCSIIIN